MVPAGVALSILMALPSRMVWAWERPEDLSFIDSSHTGVAFLAATIRLESDDGVETLPRLQPLTVPRGATLMPVVRVEIPVASRASLSVEQLARAVDALDAVVPLAGATALQIDFDARLSERAFYAELLARIRSRLPESAFLSMTALTSWCLDDQWLASLPVDEAVPMLFRMGDNTATIRKKLGAGDDFSAAICRGSAGVSTDEPITSLPRGRRYYIFHPGAWDALAFRDVETRIEGAGR